jgi:hypothetical protein
VTTIVQNTDRRVQTVLRQFPTSGTVFIEAGAAVLESNVVVATLQDPVYNADLPDEVVVVVEDVVLSASLESTDVTATLEDDTIDVEID